MLLCRITEHVKAQNWIAGVLGAHWRRSPFLLTGER